MRKILCFALAVVFCLLTVVQASEITPRYNNVNQIITDFNISSSGRATVYVSYSGTDGVTTGATITTKIEKKFLWWWNDVDNASWVDQVSGADFLTTHSVNLSSGGTYRCTYEYNIYGTGATDVISGEIEREY